jgi:leader peptidase (prepilin peptidase)/N-methyltransferase
MATGALFAGAAARFGAVPELAAYCVLFGGLVAISVADLRVRLVPRVILYPTLGLTSLAFVASAAVAGDWHPLLDALIGGGAAFSVFFAIWFVVPQGMGFGDVRLAGVIGLGLGWLGFRQVFLGFLAAFVVGALIGLVLMVVKGTGRKTALPFGPALAVGCVVGVLWGGTLANLWIHTGG